MLREFLAFLKKYGVIGLAIAVVIGGKANELVSATVKDLFMPLIGAVLPDGAWEKWTVSLGPVRLAIGHWLGVAIDFVAVAFVVFLLARYLLPDSTDALTKEATTKDTADRFKEIGGD